MTTAVTAPARLSPDKTCCGVKPMSYRRAPPYRLCPTCERAYDAAGEQIPNGAWRRVEGGFLDTRADRVRAPA